MVNLIPLWVHSLIINGSTNSAYRNIIVKTFGKMTSCSCHLVNVKLVNRKNMRNAMSITFSQQILSDRLLLVVIVGAKK